MRNRYKYLMSISCIIGDILALIFSTETFYNVTGVNRVELRFYLLENLSQLSVLTWILPAFLFRMYDFGKGSVLEKLLKDTWQVFLTQQLLFYISSIFLSLSISLELQLWQYSFILFYLFLSRVIIIFLFTRLQLKSSKVAVWGFNLVGIRLASYFDSLGQPVYILNEDEPLIQSNSDKLKQSLINAINKSASDGVKELYAIAIPEHFKEVSLYFNLADRNCLRLRFVTDASSELPGRLFTNVWGGFQVISSRPEPLEDSHNRLKKRAFDIVFSLIVIILLLSWLVPLLAILIKLETKGPVFFKQLRTGHNNKQFLCYKFRSMRVNFDSETIQAQRADRRVTALGRFMRRTSIDELPQFYNVLIGEMSVVGPRPHMLKHTSDYSQLIQNFMVRHFVKPGITGLSQVIGLRGETKEIIDMQNRVNADIEYLTNWNFMTDIKICWLTIFKAFKGDEKAF